LSEFGDALESRHQVNVERHLEAIIKQVWECSLETMIVQTWRPLLSENVDALAGHDPFRLEEDLEVVNRQVVHLVGGLTGTEVLFIG
jgi:hypothetical protein